MGSHPYPTLRIAAKNLPVTVTPNSSQDSQRCAETGVENTVDTKRYQ